MRIPEDAVIADDKLKKYLLVRRPEDDKSGFLRSAGFTLENWTELRDGIRNLADSVEAVENGSNEFGAFYRVEGPLIGPTAERSVVLIWMRREEDNRFHFVTLKPSRRWTC